MLQVTKIFRFETAHAIYGYAGHCKNIHGHSYILHVTVSREISDDQFLSAPGFVIDFKELKELVNKYILCHFDHRLILSEEYIAEHRYVTNFENLTIWKIEPTAENILLFVRSTLQEVLAPGIVLQKLKIYETNDSYAEWEK